MSRNESEFWTRARHARDELIAQFMSHPDVNLIDIGYAPDAGEGAEEIVLRIHVRERWMEACPDQRVAFPSKVAGIPVSVMHGDYRLDLDASEGERDQAEDR